MDHYSITTPRRRKLQRMYRHFGFRVSRKHWLHRVVINDWLAVLSAIALFTCGLDRPWPVRWVLIPIITLNVVRFVLIWRGNLTPVRRRGWWRE